MSIMAAGISAASLGTFAATAAVGCGRSSSRVQVAKQEGGMNALRSVPVPFSSAAAGVSLAEGSGRALGGGGSRAAAASCPLELIVGSSHRRMMTTTTFANKSSVAAVASVVQGEGKEKEIPRPVVHIDQHTDPDSTIVELSFGDRLGALLDTTKALKNLGLNVLKAKVTTEGSSVAKNTFHITRQDNGNKVVNPELLEAIRLTVINNLLKYHPESSEQLYLGEAFGVTPPAQKLDIDVATHISVKKVSPKESVLTVETADRPGLLLDIIKVITDISVMVESADINTEGLVAIDQFSVSYGGAALSPSLEEVLVNCLRYHIRKFESEDDSY